MSFQPKARHALVRAMLTGGLLASGLSFGSAAQAAISFQFNFLDTAGTGFNDASTGASRQTALNTAATMFSSMFGTYFSNSGTVVLDATATDAPLSGTLASAGSQLTLAGSAPNGFNVGEVVRTKLQTGTDLNGAAADGSVDVNFGQSWQLDPNAAVGGSQFDFYKVVFHEFTHALGFSSLVNQDGSGLFSGNHWGAFDQFLTDKNGIAVVSAGTFATNSTWTTASIGGTSPGAGMFFNGTHAVAANGGNLVGLYSPTTWEDGSSVSHIDTDNPAYAGQIMLHSASPGSGIRTYSAIEVGMMQDIGYSAIAAVPEPESYAMMFAGLGVVGWMGRRRRSNRST
ncbi:PEP-CTERM sorting domain-containing protein [Sphaerotilus sp.]|uniref:PEP-CTERM sorting domain-containing protein n=1 Tax=Sphaerotilus sp. TaxID=2093942 RepID=UPI00286E2BBA|nr:PEP-CTERM sorting domain-containing protein [Sphaerotilus sp.]